MSTLPRHSPYLSLPLEKAGHHGHRRAPASVSGRRLQNRKQCGRMLPQGLGAVADPVLSSRGISAMVLLNSGKVENRVIPEAVFSSRGRAIIGLAKTLGLNPGTLRQDRGPSGRQRRAVRFPREPLPTGTTIFDYWPRP